MTNLADNLRRLRAAIQTAAAACGRDPAAVCLLAASKGQTPAAIEAVWREGVHCFGESYLQEALPKMAALRACGIEWHFIGTIQGNKTHAIAENFSWAHSVDRIRIAERLSAQRPRELPPLNLCLQVNIDAEASKSGVAPACLAELAAAVAALPGVRLRGLMAIPRPRGVGEEAQEPYRRLAQLLADLQALSPRLAGLDTLSMGMSADMDAAIAAGATIVRIGAALFGPRRSAGATPQRSTA